MVHLANFSGSEVMAILQKHFGFVFISQRGSHIKLRKIGHDSAITVIIPDHSELAPGTLRNILHQAEIKSEEFLKQA